MMKGMFFGAVLAATFMALSGCATTEKSLQARGLSPLTQSELEALFSQTRTLRATNAEGLTGTWTFTPDGVAQGGGGLESEEASWRITGGKFCTKDTIGSGVEKCHGIYKTGENEYQAFHPDGSLAATLSFLVALSGVLSVPPATADAPTPVVKQVDHIWLRVNDPQYLFFLLTETLQLPVDFPLRNFRGFKSGGVVAGNVALEVLRLGEPQDPSPTQNVGARLGGFALEPYSLTSSLAELTRRGIPYRPLSPYTGGWIVRKTLWTNVILTDFSSDNAYIFLCEFHPDFRDPPRVREKWQRQLREKHGGVLGVRSVREIVVGVTDLGAETERWQNLLAPTNPSAPGVWKLGDGPAIHLVSHTENIIGALVLEVISLKKAEAFLQQNGMLGTVSGRDITLEPSTVQGIEIRLVEAQ